MDFGSHLHQSRDPPRFSDRKQINLYIYPQDIWHFALPGILHSARHCPNRSALPLGVLQLRLQWTTNSCNLNPFIAAINSDNPGLDSVYFGHLANPPVTQFGAPKNTRGERHATGNPIPVMWPRNFPPWSNSFAQQYLLTDIQDSVKNRLSNIEKN